MSGLFLLGYTALLIGGTAFLVSGSTVGLLAAMVGFSLIVGVVIAIWEDEEEE